MMKKGIALCLCALLILGTAGVLGGCAGGADHDRLQVVTTVFPVYDWARQIIGDTDGVELTMLLDNGVDLHSFQPTADDMIRLASCDVFFYVGGESDAWVDDALNDAANSSRVTVNLLDALGGNAKTEETVDGMQTDEESEEGEDPAEDEAPEYDEHIWLSLRNAAALCDAMCEALCRADPAHEQAYRANCEAYGASLRALDDRYVAAVAALPGRHLLVADRFPFRYLADDYALTYHAAFAGCSAESEASFETIAFLAGQVKTLGLAHVVVLEGSDGRIAEAVIQTAGVSADVVTMNSLQTVTAADVAAGADYLSVMEQNLAALQAALS